MVPNIHIKKLRAPTAILHYWLFLRKLFCIFFRVEGATTKQRQAQQKNSKGDSAQRRRSTPCLNDAIHSSQILVCKQFWNNKLVMQTPADLQRFWNNEICFIILTVPETHLNTTFKTWCQQMQHHRKEGIHCIIYFPPSRLAWMALTSNDYFSSTCSKITTTMFVLNYPEG